MKRFTIIISVIVIGLLSSCKPSVSSDQQSSSLESQPANSQIEPIVLKDSCFHLDLPSVISQRKDIFLSDLAESIQYVALETTPQYLIGDKTVQVKPCAEFIFVSEHGKPVGVFDREGNFIRTIGRIGKGPAEYNFDYAWWPEESMRRIYISNTNVRAISAYSFEGEYLGEVSTEVHSMSFVPLGNDRFLSWTFRQQSHDEKLFRMFFHDGQGSTYGRIYEPEKVYDFSRGISIMSPLFTYAPNGVLFNSWEDEQILRIKEDGSFDPAITWSLGKLKLPFNPSSDYARYNREKANYIMDFNAWESEQNWLIKYHYKNRLELAVLNKESGDYFIVDNPDVPQDGVRNDMDGGPSFWPFWYSEKGKNFFRLIQTIDLLDGELEQKKGLTIKNPQAAENFRTMVSSLRENSNPVLMIVHMK